MTELKRKSPSNYPSLKSKISVDSKKSIQIGLIHSMLWFLLRTYQRFFSPMMKNSCRFFPTCSDYAGECINSFPLWRALPMIAWRLLRCNRFSKRGLDFPN